MFTDLLLLELLINCNFLRNCFENVREKRKYILSSSFSVKLLALCYYHLGTVAIDTCPFLFRGGKKGGPFWSNRNKKHLEFILYISTSEDCIVIIQELSRWSYLFAFTILFTHGIVYNIAQLIFICHKSFTDT